MFKECINSAIKLSSKLIFLFGVGDKNKTFNDNNWFNPYNNIKLYIGAIDNSITPFESSGSFQNDIRLFFALCNEPYTASTFKECKSYEIPVNENKKTINYASILEHQYRGINNINNEYNYMYHTTIKTDDDTYKDLYNNIKELNTITFNYRIKTNIFGKQLTIDFIKVIATMLGIWNGDEKYWNDKIYKQAYKKYFNGTINIEDINKILYEAYSVYNDEMLKYTGVNSEGKFTSVLVAKPREYVDNINFTYNIEKQWEDNRMINFNIINVGLLFNSFNERVTTIDEYEIDPTSTFEFPNIYNIKYDTKDEILMKLSKFNYNLQQTVTQYIKEGSDSPEDVMLYIVPDEIINETEQYPTDTLQNSSRVNNTRVNMCDYVELIVDKTKSLIKLYNNEDDKALNNCKLSQYLPEIFNNNIVGQKSFIVSENNEPELDKYINNCKSPYLNSATFAYIANEMNEISNEFPIYPYSVALDTNELKKRYGFKWPIDDIYNVAPVIMKYQPLPVYYSDEFADEGYFPIRFNTSITDNIPGFYTDWTGSNGLVNTEDLFVGLIKYDVVDNICIIKYIVDIERFCKAIYKDWKSVYRVCYSENFLLSELLYTIIGLSEYSVVGTSKSFGNIEYSVEHFTGDKEETRNNVFKLYNDKKNNYVISKILRSITSYEDRSVVIQSINTRNYFIDNDVITNDLIMINDNGMKAIELQKDVKIEQNLYLTVPTDYIDVKNTFTSFTGDDYYKNLYNRTLRYRCDDNTTRIKIFTK